MAKVREIGKLFGATGFALAGLHVEAQRPTGRGQQRNKHTDTLRCVATTKTQFTSNHRIEQYTLNDAPFFVFMNSKGILASVCDSEVHVFCVFVN